jgi:hypothetical protein
MERKRPRTTRPAIAAVSNMSLRLPFAGVYCNQIAMRECRRQPFGLTSVPRFDIVSNVLIYQRLVGGTSQTLNLFGAGGKIVVLRLEFSTRYKDAHPQGPNRQLVAWMTRRLGRGQQTR